MVKHVNSNELEELIKSTDKTVFCDFWASWCGPCRMLAPVFEELAEKYEGQAEFVKVDVDENEEAAMKYRVNSIPNVMAFKGGQPIDSSLGFVPAAVLEAFVKNKM
jgi:thioredoxin 1